MAKQQAKAEVRIKRAGKANAWATIQNLAVTRRTGNLLTRNGRPLRASKLKIYATDISYEADPRYKRITSTGGIGGTSTRFRYPNALRYGIVLSQPGGTTQNILGESASKAQDFNLDNTKDIIINVNDADTAAAYGDNVGAFDIVIQIVQPLKKRR